MWVNFSCQKCGLATRTNVHIGPFVRTHCSECNATNVLEVRISVELVDVKLEEREIQQ